MVNPDLKESLEKELPGKLQKLMFLRVLFVSLLLGASIFIQIKQSRTYFGNIQTSHYVLISFIYFLTFIYVILLSKIKRLIKLAYFQLLMDTVIVTAIIYSTGGLCLSINFKDLELNVVFIDFHWAFDTSDLAVFPLCNVQWSIKVSHLLDQGQQSSISPYLEMRLKLVIFLL